MKFQSGIASCLLVLGMGAGVAVGQECSFEHLGSLRIGKDPSERPGVDRQGELLYATINGALRIYDVSVPEAPRLLSMSSLINSSGVAVDGPLIVLSGAGTVATVDVADPAAPRLLDTVATPGAGVGVVIDGFIAFVADGEEGITAVDISDPGELRVLDVLDTPGQVVNIAVQDGIAYVADVEGGVRIIDVRDPVQMVEIASLTQWNAYSVAIEGSILAVAAGRDGVAFIDVRDPSAPVVVTMIGTKLPPWAVHLIESVAWISIGSHIGNGEFFGLDIRDPAAPVEFGRVKLLSPFEWFKGSYALAFAVANHDAHIVAYHYDTFRPLEIELHAIDLTPCTVCYADCDGSGALDFFDFLCFQNLFAAGDPRADCDGSGELEVFDFLCFQNAFLAGCL